MAAATMTKYFNAINAHDYVTAYGLTSSTWQDSNPYSTYAQGYRSTQISNVKLLSATEDPTLDIEFQSTQDPSDAPPSSYGATCLIWNERMEFQYENGQYVISKFKKTTDPAFHSC